jgi:hypothetical protein
MKQKYFSCLDSISTSMQVQKEHKSFQQKLFHDLVRYFFVDNPVLGGTIVLRGNAAI